MMTSHKSLLLLPIVAMLLNSCGEGRSPKPSNALDSVSYAIGVTQGDGLKRSMKASNIELNEELLRAGIRDGLSNDSLAALIKPQDAEAVIRTFFEKRLVQKKKDNLENGRNFLAENAKKAGVQTTASGVQYLIEREGTGAQPKGNDTVEINYRAMLIDGKVFESSYEHNRPVRFCLNEVIKGWSEGIQLMKEGGKYRIFIPTELAYGEYVYNDSPFEANVPLIFDVELIKVIPGIKNGQ